MLPDLDPATLRAAEEYLRLQGEIRRLEHRRDLVKALLLDAVRDAPVGLYATGAGPLRVSVFRTARFDPPRVAQALDARRLLREVALVQGARVRKAMDAVPAVEAALAGLAERVDLPFVAPVPGPLATGITRSGERARERDACEATL